MIDDVLLYIKRDDINIYIYICIFVTILLTFRKNRKRYKTETFFTESNALMAFKSAWKN